MREVSVRKCKKHQISIISAGLLLSDMTLKICVPMFSMSKIAGLVAG